MTRSTSLLPLALSAFLSAGTSAAAFDASRQAVEAGFPKASLEAVAALGCSVMPQNKEVEICVFQGGEAVAVSFIFDSNTKAFRAASVFFAEKEADLAISLGRAALSYARYANASSVDFRQLMRKASLGGTEVALPQAVASVRKSPPNLFVITFAPAGE
jgi:hypothetical protein